VAEELDAVATHQKAAEWAQADAALERAAAHLDGRRLGDLQARLDQARRDSNLVPRLEELRATAYYEVNKGAPSRTDSDYAAAFTEAGIIDGDVAPDVAAQRIAASNVRPALVAALYAWSVG